MRYLAAFFALAGCAIHPTVEKTVERAVPQECPGPTIVKVAPPPVYPDSCVADWYAKANLPPCVETYLKQMKTRQKSMPRTSRAK